MNKKDEKLTKNEISLITRANLHTVDFLFTLVNQATKSGNRSILLQKMKKKAHHE